MQTARSKAELQIQKAKVRQDRCPSERNIYSQFGNVRVRGLDSQLANLSCGNSSRDLTMNSCSMSQTQS